MKQPPHPVPRRRVAVFHGGAMAFDSHARSAAIAAADRLEWFGSVTTKAFACLWNLA